MSTSFTTKKLAGLALLEVLLAIALLSLCGLAILAVLGSNLRLNSQSKEAYQAMQLAQQIIERSRHNYTLAASSQTYLGSQNDPQINGFPPAPYPKVDVAGTVYTFTVRVEPTSNDKLRTVSVDVEWAPNHRTHLQTQVYQP